MNSIPLLKRKFFVCIVPGAFKIAEMHAFRAEGSLSPLSPLTPLSPLSPLTPLSPLALLPEYHKLRLRGSNWFRWTRFFELFEQRRVSVRTAGH